jgi:hypothetical protein
MAAPEQNGVKLMAKKLNRNRPKGGKRSLREIAKELAVAGWLSANGKPYNPNSVRQMLM